MSKELSVTIYAQAEMLRSGIIICSENKHLNNEIQYTRTSEVIKVLEGSKCKTGTGFRAGYNQGIDDAIKAIGAISNEDK